VRFWDSSAVTPLLTSESSTPTIEDLAREDPAVVVWWTTSVECASALARLRRSGLLTEEGERDALAVLEALAGSWTEVRPGNALRATAMRLLRVHALRAADALQLAAALSWAEGDPRGRPFVCLDERLRTAAGREGFAVLPG